MDVVDYQRSFWVNADMSWSEVTAALDARGLELIPGEKIVAFLSNLLFKVWDPAKQKVSRAESMQLRRMLGPFLGNSDELFARIQLFKGLDSVVIKARNDVVVERLGQWLAQSTDRRVAIFYGAAHMPDLMAKITGQYGLRYLGTEWLEAWYVE
jgi:hypothetical protein